MFSNFCTSRWWNGLRDCPVRVLNPLKRDRNLCLLHSFIIPTIFIFQTHFSVINISLRTPLLQIGPHMFHVFTGPPSLFPKPQATVGNPRVHPLPPLMTSYLEEYPSKNCLEDLEKFSVLAPRPLLGIREYDPPPPLMGLGGEI